MNSPRIRAAWLAWLSICMLIPLFSVYGRKLQVWMSGQFDRQQLAVFFAAILVSASIMAGLYLIRRRGVKQAWHMLWFSTVFVVLPFYVPFIEERIHFILFGIFGFLTLWIYPWFAGFVIVFGVSGMDELLQHFLPDRVGDWQDVLFNSLAASAGALFALLVRERRS